MEFAEALEKSASLAELHTLCDLPEPYDDRGYFFIYYAELDYKRALSDVVRFIGGGMRIYYDRRIEHGRSWQNDYLVKCRSLRCRCVVFYLSEHSFFDDTFKKLCRSVYENGIPYVSVNIAGEYGIQSGEQTVERLGSKISAEMAKIYKKLFSNEITYIPDTFSTDEKRVSLEKAYSKPVFSFSVNGDHAVLDRIRDITEEEVAVPRNVMIGDADYTVKEISPAAFAGCKDLRRITFPETIESIGVRDGGMLGNMLARTFDNCKSLTELVFPPSLKKFGAGNLTGCSGLKRLIFGDDTKFVADETAIPLLFYTGGAGLDPDEELSDAKFEEIKLPSSVKITADGDFVACISGKYGGLVVPETEKLWGYTEWKIDKDVYVDAHADPSYLCGSDEIESVTFDPEWRNGNLYSCFSSCENLKRVELPKRCYTLSGTFCGCTALETIELPQTLMRIEDDTFAGCIGLKEMTLPRSVTYVASNAFDGCVGLETLVVDNPDCRKLMRGGVKPQRQKCRTAGERAAYFFGLFKVPFVVLKNMPAFIAMSKQPPFYANTGIREIYIKSKRKIKGFRRCDSDRDGYYKFVRR